MIKQPFLPLKFYNEVEEQQFRKLMFTTAKDWVKLRTDTILPIPFQIKRATRANIISQFDIVNYDTGVVANIATTHLDIKTATVDGVLYDWIVCDGRPWANDIDEGFYYLIVSDDIETWYSEVFELCDLYTNLLDDGINDSFDGWSDTTTPAIKREQWFICKSTAAGIATAHSNAFDVIYNEPLSLYVYTSDTNMACGYTSFGDAVKYELRDTLGNVVSNIVTTEEGWNCFTLTPTITGEVRLYARLDDTEQAEQSNILYLWPKKLDGHTVMEWTDSINFCDIIYTDPYDNNNCLYVNKLIIEKSHTVKPTYAIEEDAVENDKKETSPLVQSAQKFYKMDMAGGHHLTDALSIVRLHDDIRFYLETGEILDICDFTMNNSPFNDYCELIDLTFRETACFKDNCDHYTFECCCPTVVNVLDVVPGALGACGAPQTGDRYLHLNAVPFYIEECSGAAWVRQTDEEVLGNCVYDEDTDTSETYNQYWYWNGNGVPPSWAQMCILSSVTDNTDGTATLNIGAAQSSDDSDLSYFPCPYYVQAEYDPGTGFEAIGQAVSSEVADTDGITVTTGAGNFDFRVRYYTHNCDLSYDGDTNQTITDV